MQILYSVLILGGMGALLGALLYYVSKKFAVEIDPRIDDVARNLAGINCGGCGYSGCNAFAAALVKGEAKVGACRPTSAEKKKEINKILKVSDVSSYEETAAVVLCNGGNDALNKFSYQGYGNCRTSQVLAQGSKVCPVGCMGLKDCAAACAFEAVDVDPDAQYAVVKPSRCVSCGACVSACPKKIIARIPRRAKYFVACNNHAAGGDLVQYCAAGCIGCGLCAKACKFDAVKTADNLAVIDYQKCVGCGACHKVCPTKVIKARAAT